MAASARSGGDSGRGGCWEAGRRGAAVTELGFKGAMIHGMANGEFVDGRKYWPIFVRAERLGMPLSVADKAKIASGNAQRLLKM